jgi:hypothetical protein
MLSLLTAVLLAAGVPISAHRELPSEVAKDLRARGCEIVRGQGIASGEFSGPGRRDWAVLCQIGHQASLLIYIEGSRQPAVMATGEV